jgi:hypothetical protein
MDIEWLLSTLFDASLLSPWSRRQRRLFFVPFWGSPENFRAGCAHAKAPCAGQGHLPNRHVRRINGLSLRGNYVASFAASPSGQTGPGRVMLTQSYTGRAD